MTSEDGKPLIKPVHVVDAFIVAGIVFFSLLIGTGLTALYAGQAEYIGIEQVFDRGVTAILAFCLTFLAQWARYRGIQIVEFFNGGNG